MPYLSFIMPIKNVAKYIKDAIEGVENQLFEDSELIIVDDA